MQISDALLKMEKVAEYINEMQRIYEEYGALFSQIQSQNKHIQDVSGVKSESERGLSVESNKPYFLQTSFELCDLLMFGEVDWLNSNEDQNKKKLVPLECLCFVFKSAILLMSQENKRPRKTKVHQFFSPDSNLFPLVHFSEYQRRKTNHVPFHSDKRTGNKRQRRRFVRYSFHLDSHPSRSGFKDRKNLPFRQ